MDKARFDFDCTKKGNEFDLDCRKLDTENSKVLEKTRLQLEMKREERLLNENKRN